MGFFSFFRDYITNFADTAKPLTDLTCKKIPAKLSDLWNETHEEAFQSLKSKLCQATQESLQIADFSKPFTIHVDSSGYAVSAVVSETTTEGNERPVAFGSSKLTNTQKSWPTIEKETYATIWALSKYRNWIFGKPVAIVTDHSPITFLAETAPKSSKLMRWALAIQEYDVTFGYKAGKHNVAADSLSRMESGGEPESSHE